MCNLLSNIWGKLYRHLRHFFYTIWMLSKISFTKQTPITNTEVPVFISNTFKHKYNQLSKATKKSPFQRKLAGVQFTRTQRTNLYDDDLFKKWPLSSLHQQTRFGFFGGVDMHTNLQLASQRCGCLNIFGPIHFTGAGSIIL